MNTNTQEIKEFEFTFKLYGVATTIPIIVILAFVYILGATPEESAVPISLCVVLSCTLLGISLTAKMAANDIYNTAIEDEITTCSKCRCKKGCICCKNGVCGCTENKVRIISDEVF